MVGFFWGVTNPFLKRGTAGVTNIHEDNRFLKILKEIVFLTTNWKVLALISILKREIIRMQMETSKS